MTTKPTARRARPSDAAARQQLSQALKRAPTSPAPGAAGRPKSGGKKTDPAYGAFTVYLRRDTHMQFRAAIFPKEVSVFFQECVDAELARAQPAKR